MSTQHIFDADNILAVIRDLGDEKAFNTDPDDEERIAEIDAEIERMMTVLEDDGHLPARGIGR